MMDLFLRWRHCEHSEARIMDKSGRIKNTTNPGFLSQTYSSEKFMIRRTAHNAKITK
jgi:hypothetical protein